MASEDNLQPYMLFTLTDLIGKKATDQRTTVIATVETPLRTAIWLFASLIISGVPALILGFASPLGTWALLIPMIMVPAITVFATGRSRRGLQLTHLQRTFHRLEAGQVKAGMLIHLGRIYDPLAVDIATVTRSTVDVDDVADWPRRRTIDVIEQDEEQDAQYVPLAQRRMTLRSARGQAEEQTRIRSGIMEAQRVMERREWMERYEQRMKDQQERVAAGMVLDPSDDLEEVSA